MEVWGLWLSLKEKSEEMRTLVGSLFRGEVWVTLCSAQGSLHVGSEDHMLGIEPGLASLKASTEPTLLPLQSWFFFYFWRLKNSQRGDSENWSRGFACRNPTIDSWHHMVPKALAEVTPCTVLCSNWSRVPLSIILKHKKKWSKK